MQVHNRAFASQISLNELPFDGQVCSKPILELGYDKFCMINNHFDVMENIPLEGNVDFFKKQVGDYYKAANTMNENIIGSFEYFDANIFIWVVGLKYSIC